MFDILPHTPSLSESDTEADGSRCGKLSQVSLKRLRKIVERQQLSGSENFLFLNGTEANSSSEDDVSDRLISLLSGNEERQTNQTPRKLRHRMRKVTEGTAPSGYPGFSVLHPSETASDRHALGFSRTENSTKFAKSSPDRRVARQHMRSLDSKPNASHPLKRFVAVATKPSNTSGCKSSTSSLERKPIRKPRAARNPSQSRERKIAGNKPQSTVGELSQATVPNNNLPVDREPGDLSVLEQVQQLIGADMFRVNNEGPETAGISSRKVPSKKGLYRAERKNKRPVLRESAPPTENVCKRQRGVSRADLQALVRKQREVRKAERLNKERAERERRERIQRNLSATAQAAAAAAKAPLPSPRRPLVLTNRNAARGIDDRYRDPAELLLPESNPDADFVLERQRKLDELLKNDAEQGITWSPRILNGLSTNPRSARSIGSASSVNHLVPNRQTNYRTTGPPWVRDPVVRKDASSETVVQNCRTRSQSTTTVPVDYTSFSHPGAHRHQAMPSSKPTQFSPRTLGHHSQYEPLWIPLSCHVPDSGSSEQPEQHSVLVLHPTESHHEDEHGVSSVSSLEEVSAPDTTRWMRLEAVGASEPETSAMDEPGGQFVDDLKSSDFDPIQLERRVDALLRLSRAPMTTDPDGCTELAAFTEIRTSDYLDLKRFIYNDPLRLGALMKRDVQFDANRLKNKSSMPVRETKMTAQQQVILTTVSKAPCSIHSCLIPGSTPSSGLSPRSTGTAQTSHNVQQTSTLIRSPLAATQTKKSPHSAQSTVDPSVITMTATTSPCQVAGSNSSSEQQDFITRAASDAISSTPRRESVRATTLLHNVTHQTAPHLVHGVSLPPRLTATALSLRLSEEVNHLEALACSIQHVADMESLRQFAGAQTETVALAHLLKSQQTEPEPKHSLSPKVSTPRKQPTSVRSKATSITPEALHSHRELHSPQFAEVIRAAEEFHKVERRLSQKAAQIETPGVNKRSKTLSEVSSPTGRTKVMPEEYSYSSGANDSRSAGNVFHHPNKSSSKLSPNSIRYASDVVSEVSTAPPDSSAPESARSLSTDRALSAADDSTSVNHSATLVFQEKLASEAQSISTASRGSPTSVNNIRCEVSPGSTSEIRTRSTDSFTPIVRSPSQQSPLSSGDVVKSLPTTHQTKVSSSPTAVLPQHAGDSTRPACSSITPLNRTDDGSEDVLSLTQIDSGLLKRAAILKMRRERAEKLLALSRNLEKEEAEVVRLEMEALKAYQAKRKRARVEGTKCRITGPSTVTSTTVDRATSFSPKHSRHSVDHRGTSMTPLSPSRRSTGHEINDRSRTLTPHVASPAGDSVFSVRDLSNLSHTNLISQAQTVTTSIRARDETVRGSSSQYGHRASSIVHTISTATVVKSLGSTTSGLHSGADGQRDVFRISDKNVHTPISPGRSKHSENRSPRGHSKSVTGESDTGAGTPQLRKHLITTADLLSSSSDRVTPPTPKQLPQHPATASGSEFSYSARRRRISSSNLSGPTSADSVDEDHGTEVLTAEDHSVSVASVSNSSQIDRSAMESRIRALHANLQRQEAILAMINQRHKYMSTDRLVRFESTVLQHKQLCTDIIESIKRQLRDCQPAALLDSHSHQSLAPSPTAERAEPGSQNCSTVSHEAATSVVRMAQEVSLSYKSVNHASRFEEPQERSQIHTVVSLAEDLVSATDTEGDLQKLGFDDRVESTASSATLDEQAATSSTMTSPDLQQSEHNVYSNEQSPRAGDELSVNDSLKSVSDAVCSTVPSGRATGTSAHDDDEVQTPVCLELSAVEDEMLSVATNSPPGSQAEMVCSTLKYAQERGLSPPLSLENPVASSEPMPHYAPIQLSASDETNLITTIKDEAHSSIISIGTGNSAGNGVVLKPLPRSVSVKLGAVSNLPSCSASDADTAHVTQVPLDGATDVLDSPSCTVDSLEPIPETQTVLRSSITSPVQLTGDSKKPSLVENLTRELFKKLVSDVINDAVRAQDIKEKFTEKNQEDENDLSELSRSMVSLRDIPDEPVEDNLKPEVTEPAVECESESDTGEASVSLLVPSIFSTENIRGLVADVPARTEPLIRLAFDYLWQKRLEAPDGAREPALSAATLTPLAAFQFDLLEDEDLNPDLYSLPSLRFISRRLLLDVVCEVMQQIYAGEDEEFARRRAGQSARPRVTSSQFRLWQGHTRPTEKERLYDIVHTNVQQVLGLRSEKSTPNFPDADLNFSDLREISGKLSSGTRFSRLAQWTLSKKPYLDRLLELELRADEGSWLSYVPEEQRLKQNLSQQIWDELMQDAIESMLKAARLARSDGPPDSIPSNVKVVT